MALESLSEMLNVGEPARPGDLLDRHVRGPQQLLGMLDAQAPTNHRKSPRPPDAKSIRAPVRQPTRMPIRIPISESGAAPLDG